MEKAVEFILSRFSALRNRLDEHMLEVINGAAVALVLKVLGAGLTFLFNLVLARTLGAEGAGLYFLALTVTTIATVFGRLGLDNVLLRYVAANASIDDWRAVKGVYVKGMRLAFIASSLSAVAVFVFTPTLADEVFQKPELVIPMRWMSLAVVPITMLILYAEMLKGLKRIRDSLLVFGVGVPAFSLAALLLLGGNYGVKGAVWAYASGAILTALLGVTLWRIAAPKLREISTSFRTNELLKSSIPLFWVASLNMLTNWTATFALGIWGTKEDVGVFGMASRTAMLTSLILTSVNSISAPKFAELYKKKDMVALGATAKNTAKLMTLIASPLLILFLVVPQWFMGMFGEEFQKGGILLSILAIGQFVNVATGSVGYLLIMSGNEKLMRNNVIFIAIISIVLNVVLDPLYGALGAVVATAVPLAVQNLIAAYLVNYRLGIKTVSWLPYK
ncbi:flippase [Prosthecochloris sp. SCSIO W1103]|uniref:flippase n=1 Tax=Prosthecochloris sp. SCSIO W1103 TaxID=2992244 RepID=UPI00223E4316|nr:flippase [Prosthecochloris sp. SCSIO W1103]UZJ38141.1 flippase [Prosthecochloris sp. SCSIO W1103]